MADDDHKIKVLARPCPCCPWRLTTHASDIPRFSLVLAEALAETCPDEHGIGPAPRTPMFSCHQSVPGNDIPCAGWLAQVGDCHVGVRIALHEERLERGALRPGADWPALHDNYPAVLAKLREDVTAAAQGGGRAWNAPTETGPAEALPSAVRSAET